MTAQRRRVEFYPRTFGTWTCMTCQCQGIGGLNAFYVHYYKEHEPEKGKTNVK